MKKDELLKLNIQLFAEDMADNATDEDETDELDEETVEDEVDTDDADGEDSTGDEVDEPEQDPEEDKKRKTKEYSERLKKDREKIEKEVEAKAKKRQDDFAKSKGFSNWEEYEEAAERAQLEEAGITDPEGFRSVIQGLIERNPIVQKAQDIINNQEKERVENFVSNEISQINKIDDNVKTFDDLVRLDRYDSIAEKVEKGYSLSDAYKLVYFDNISTAKVASAKQETLKKITSKSHLKTSTGASGEGVHVPADVMAMYKANMPKWTDAEIHKDYAKFVKGEK